MYMYMALHLKYCFILTMFTILVTFLFLLFLISNRMPKWFWLKLLYVYVAFFLLVYFFEISFIRTLKFYISVYRVVFISRYKLYFLFNGVFFLDLITKYLVVCFVIVLFFKFVNLIFTVVWLVWFLIKILFYFFYFFVFYLVWFLFNVTSPLIYYYIIFFFPEFFETSLAFYCMFFFDKELYEWYEFIKSLYDYYCFFDDLLTYLF